MASAPVPKPRLSKQTRCRAPLVGRADTTERLCKPVAPPRAFPAAAAAAAADEDWTDSAPSPSAFDNPVYFNLDSFRSLLGDEAPSPPVEKVLSPVGHSICFSSWVSLLDRRHTRWWCCLKDLRLSFSASDVEADQALHFVIHCERIVYVGRVAENDAAVTIVFTKENAPEVSQVLQLSVEDAQIQSCWLLLLGKSIAPSSEASEIMEEPLAMGRLRLKQGSTENWHKGWACLAASRLTYCLQDDSNFYEIDLRKVITLQTVNEANDAVLLTLDGSSLYLSAEQEGVTTLWKGDVERQLMRRSSCLSEQRLSADEVPVIVEKCIKFISAHGLAQEGLYRIPGNSAHVRRLMEDLKRDPHGVHLRKENDATVHTVAETLRRFFRQLQEPLFTSENRERFFQVCHLPESDAHKKVELYRQALATLPPLNYVTLRKLFGHLSDVTQLSAVNRATVANVAKVFGPTLMTVDREVDEQLLTTGGAFRNTQHEVQVTADLLSNYAAVFDVSDDELAKTCSILSVQDNIRSIADQKGLDATKKPAGSFRVAIHLFEVENEAFFIEMDKCAGEVCHFAVKHKTLPLHDGPYALFEAVRGGQLVRRVAPEERLQSIIVGRWYAWGDTAEISDCFLVIRKDTLTPCLDAIDPYPFASGVRFADNGAKSFKKTALQFSGGKICRYKDMKQSQVQQAWNVEDLIWFVGCETKRDAPSEHCLTLIERDVTPRRAKFFGMCLSFRQQSDMYRWLAAILQFKPSTASHALQI